jgi:hypothetical protein
MYTNYYNRGFQTMERAPRVALLVPWGGGELFTWLAFILNKIWAQDKIYILVGTLLGSNMMLALFCSVNISLKCIIDLENYVTH